MLDDLFLCVDIYRQIRNVYTTMLKNILTIIVLTMATNLTLNADNASPASKEKYLQAYGWIIGTQSGLTQLGLSSEEIKSLLSGVQSAAAGQKSPVNLQEINT